MSVSRVIVLALAISIPALSAAQWRWTDKAGRTVFSDQPPPGDIPAANIVKQPGVRSPAPSEPAAVPVNAAKAAPPLRLPASAAGGKDRDLQARKKQAEAAEEEKRKAQEEEIARLRSENCARAKRSKLGFDSGARIARTNDKGEREYLDDAARAAEVRRLEAVIASDCKPAGG